MGQALDQFVAECQAALDADPGPAGRHSIRTALQRRLRDDAFVREAFRAGPAARRLLYEDPAFGFCILAHHYADAGTTPIHDHGPTWAIYGQAAGQSRITEYEQTAAAGRADPAKVRAVRSYTLKPGDAYLYNEGDLHAVQRAAGAEFIRVEGRNLEGVARRRFEAG